MSDNKELVYVKCCVKNCQKQIVLEEAMKINDNYFCSICGVAYYRSFLNF
ncbi:MAG: hypothetical protein JXA99_13125 [Candidatus Lokiarchaeota archaeon]|nr:hypothetical protein [Candidatus Lokiarchaeota archaeon]